MPRQYTPRVECVCGHCGKRFSRPPSQLKTAPPHFCSQQCHYAAKPVSLKDHLHQRVSEPTVTGCILWTGRVNNRGYGIIDRTSLGGGILLAHRVAWELAHGTIPDGLEVCHNCPGGDNPLCVNPAHHFLGTHADNMRDAAAKKQMRHGQVHRAAKLTEAKVVSIRARYAESSITQQQLADEFSVSNSVISQIVNRKAWAHVP